MEAKKRTKREWKIILKEQRQAVYRKMKENRKAYMNRPEVKERMQIAKAKMKNKRKAFMKMVNESRKKSRDQARLIKARLPSETM